MLSGYNNFTGPVYDIITTDEKVVGEWLNNKPLYEKVYQGSMVKNTVVSTTTFYNYNVDTNLSGVIPVYMTGYVVPEGGGAIPIPIGRPTSTSWYLRIVYRYETHLLEIQQSSSSSTLIKDLSGLPFMVVIRYYKE